MSKFLEMYKNEKIVQESIYDNYDILEEGFIDKAKKNY